MRKIFHTTLALAMLLAVGCTQETEKAKTPGSPAAPTEENTFRLEVPTTAPNIAQGGDELVKIGVDRGENLKGEVTLAFTPPAGVTIEPASPKIAADQDEVEFTVKVAADAAAGEKSIPVKGTADGKEASGSFMVEVTEP